ncbi:acyl-CoA thioesterase [Blastococcus sp. SYSU DS0973]
MRTASPPRPPTCPDVRHEHPVRLRWSDPDMLGHVNHARALSLLEDARLALGDDHAGGGLILARLEVDYLRQLYYRVGEELCVHSWVTRLGTKSFTMRQELAQDGEVAIRADVVLVVFDFAANASRPMTEAERAHWTRYLEG